MKQFMIYKSIYLNRLINQPISDYTVKTTYFSSEKTKPNLYYPKNRCSLLTMFWKLISLTAVRVVIPN